jgi:hypothetical protein
MLSAMGSQHFIHGSRPPKTLSYRRVKAWRRIFRQWIFFLLSCFTVSRFRSSLGVAPSKAAVICSALTKRFSGSTARAFRMNLTIDAPARSRKRLWPRIGHRKGQRGKVPVMNSYRISATAKQSLW